MKKLPVMIAGLVLVCAAVVGVAQMIGPGALPRPLDREPANVRPITINIEASVSADASYPVFIAPCNGYIKSVRIASTSGTAAADTSTTQYWQLFLVNVDSTYDSTPSDTIASWSTKSSTGANTLTAHQQYSMTMSSQAAERQIYRKEAIEFTYEESGTCTGIAGLVITIDFQPNDTRERN